MVGDFQVRQLMDDDIVDYFRWRHYQSPGEIQGSPAAAGSPTGAGAGDVNILENQMVAVSQHQGTLIDYLACLIPVPGNENLLCLGLQVLLHLEAFAQ